MEGGRISKTLQGKRIAQKKGETLNIPLEKEKLYFSRGKGDRSPSAKDIE